MSESASRPLLTLPALLECAERNGIWVVMLKRATVIAAALSTSKKLAGRGFYSTFDLTTICCIGSCAPIGSFALALAFGLTSFARGWHLLILTLHGCGMRCDTKQYSVQNHRLHKTAHDLILPDSKHPLWIRSWQTYAEIMVRCGQLNCCCAGLLLRTADSLQTQWPGVKILHETVRGVSQHVLASPTCFAKSSAGTSWPWNCDTALPACAILLLICKYLQV